MFDKYCYYKLRWLQIGIELDITKSRNNIIGLERSAASLTIFLLVSEDNHSISSLPELPSFSY
jgi:hypothetical protein